MAARYLASPRLSSPREHACHHLPPRFALRPRPALLAGDPVLATRRRYIVTTKVFWFDVLAAVPVFLPSLHAMECYDNNSYNSVGPQAR